MTEATGSVWGEFRRHAMRVDNVIALVLGIGIAMAGLCAIVFIVTSQVGFVGLAGGTALYTLWVSRSLFGFRAGQMQRLIAAYVLMNLFAPLLVAVPVSILHLVAMLFPAYRAAVAGAVEHSTSFFDGVDNPVVQTILILLVTWLFGALIVLALVLVVLLPVLAIMRPGLAMEGSHIEKVAPARQTLATRLVFVGLSPLVVGIVLWALDGEHIRYFPEMFGWVVRDIAAGTLPHGGDFAFVLGVLLVFGGGAAVTAGCAIVATARVNASENGRR